MPPRNDPVRQTADQALGVDVGCEPGQRLGRGAQLSDRPATERRDEDQRGAHDRKRRGQGDRVGELLAQLGLPALAPGLRLAYIAALSVGIAGIIGVMSVLPSPETIFHPVESLACTTSHEPRVGWPAGMPVVVQVPPE